MNNEELDEARVKEGRRIVQDRHPAHIPQIGEVAREVARLARENWTPPEPVSDDLLAARAHAKASGWAATAVDAGSCDHTDGVVSYLAGCARGRKGAKGLVEAVQWYADNLNAPDGARSYKATADAWRDVSAALASAKRGG